MTADNDDFFKQETKRFLEEQEANQASQAAHDQRKQQLDTEGPAMAKTLAEQMIELIRRKVQSEGAPTYQLIEPPYGMGANFQVLINNKNNLTLHYSSSTDFQIKVYLAKDEQHNIRTPRYAEASEEYVYRLHLDADRTWLWRLLPPANAAILAAAPKPVASADVLAFIEKKIIELLRK